MKLVGPRKVSPSAPRDEQWAGSQRVALPSMAPVTPKAGMTLHCGK
jgi:hypothetical protein